MNHIVYLDNSATTKPCTAATENIFHCLSETWANPSSTHKIGMDAFFELDKSRNAVASSVGCRSDEIFFTGSGSEANNLAIKGAALSRKRLGNRIVTTALEHPSVLKTVEFLGQNGFETVFLSPDRNGTVSHEKFAAAINQNTILVSMMFVNNEIGTISDPTAVRRIINDCGAPALLHCDAVQAYGKLPIKVKALGADLLSASGHKIHAAKGIGFLYKEKSVHLTPLIHGGGQEIGLRSGTEALPLIAGMRGAVESLPDLQKQLSVIQALRDYAANKLLATKLVSLNSPENALPYILNISVNGYKAEPLLNALSAKGIYVSKGSACAKGHRSYVLAECGFSNDRIDSALRLSFSRYTTQEDIDLFCDALIEITGKLRKFR